MRAIFFLPLLLVLGSLPLWAAAPLTPGQVAEYTAMLQGGNEQLCVDAAGKLAMDGQSDLLLATLKSDQASRRLAVVFALRNCLNEKVADELMAILKNDAEPRVRLAAVGVLKLAYIRPELKDKRPEVEAAFKAAANDADGPVAVEAIVNVARTAPDYVDFLLDVLAHGCVGLARGQAATMLAMTKDARSKDARIYHALIKAISDPDIEASSRAVTALGQLGDGRAAPLLLELLQDRKRPPQLLAASAQALAALAAPEVLEPLLALVETGEPEIHEQALIALGGYTDPRVAPLMVTALTDKADWARASAARILGELKYAPAAGALLVQLPKETGKTARFEMLRALALLAEPRARELFTAALDEKGLLRLTGIQGLLALNDERAFAIVTEMLRDPSSTEAFHAVRLLGFTDSPLVIEPLLQYIQRKKEQITGELTGGVWTGEELNAIRKFTGGNLNGFTDDPTAPVTIGVKRADGGPLIAGEVVEALVTLYNTSKQAVVVLRLMPMFHQGEDPIVLAGPVYGDVTEKEGGYIHDFVAQQPSKIPLHAGLLLPGQAMQVKVTYRPVGFNECFLVSYLRAARQYDGTPASLAPLSVFIPDPAKDNLESRAYEPFTDAGWRALCKSMPVAEPTGPGAAERAVIVKMVPGTVMLEAPVITSLRTVFGDFPILEQLRGKAAEIAGRPADELALGYSKALGGYVVIEDHKRWLLVDDFQTERGKTLPAFPLQLLKDADRGKVRVQIDPRQPDAEPEGEKFWDVYPVERGDGMYTHGLFITVDAAGLPAFLDAVLAHHGSLEMDQYFFSSRYYKLKM